MRIISLGWGVQSFTLAAMSALGDLPKVDYAIHADTTHESQLTYEFAKKWTPWLEERGVKVITVKPDNSEITDKWGGVMLPAYTGINSRINRQCTYKWKIAPVRKWLQAKRNKEFVDQWIGISLDEFQRMRDSDVKYIKNCYPLIEKRLSRLDCIKWLTKNGLEIPSKSACTFCPFHTTREWQEIKRTPIDWMNAILVDSAIREALLPGRLFIHPSRKPLDQVDFRTAEEKGQLSLWDNECTGMCGI
jgi:hypothetical protein